MTETIRTGGCLCGDLRYEVRGEPFKGGICHCADCRRITGSAFLHYADWRPHQFTYSGPFETYEGRSFCPRCGSHTFNFGEDQVEIHLGTLDEAPGNIRPQVEGWCIRREPWLPAIPGVPMFPEDP